MLRRIDLQDLVVKALQLHNGRASIVQVAQYIWSSYESELESSGDLLFTWQYDMRWACTKLRLDGIVKAASASEKGIWELRKQGS